MHRQHVVEFTTQQHLPSVFSTREWVVTGGLMSYGPSFPDLNRRAATYVDKILKSTKPADLPVEQATKFELVINLKTAQTLGLTIPPTLLFQATEVIQETCHVSHAVAREVHGYRPLYGHAVECAITTDSVYGKPIQLWCTDNLGALRRKTVQFSPDLV